jgi:hypothetical protein
LVFRVGFFGKGVLSDGAGHGVVRVGVGGFLSRGREGEEEGKKERKIEAAW